MLGVAYNEWSATSFNDGDTIIINHNPPPPQPPQPPPQPPAPPPPTKLILNQSITINNGNVNATIMGIPKAGSSATIGHFTNGSKSISGNGTIHFNVQSASPLPAFKLKNTIFDIQSGFTLSGTTNAFDISGGSFSLSTSASQEINIQGNIKLQNSSSKITLKGANQQIQGNISANASPTELNLQDGGKVIGNFTGSGNGNKFDLSVTGVGSLFQGDMSNNGTAKITVGQSGAIKGNFKGTAVNRNDLELSIQQNGTFQGNIDNIGHTFIKDMKGLLIGDIKAGGAKFEMDLDGGTFKGNATIGGTQDNKITAKNNSNIIGGITTNTKATISLKDSIIKNGASFFNTNTTLTFEGSSQAQNASFELQNGTSTITFKDQSLFDNSSITTNGGNSEIKFSNNSKSQQGSQISVKNNATSKLSIKDNAQINGTTLLTQGGKHEITFQNNTSADNSTIRVESGTGNLLIKDSAILKNTKFQTNAGEHHIKFQDNTQVQSGTFILNGGQATLKVQDASNINATFIQNGGVNKVDFKNTSKLSGNIIQTNGAFTLNFKDTSTLTGNINQAGGTSTITFTDQTKQTGNISVTGGTTDITFTGKNAGSKTNTTNAQIIGNISAKGSLNNVTFTQGTKLTGNLTLDGLGAINGVSKASITEAYITGDVQGFDEVTLTLKSSQVDGAIKQGGSFSQMALKGTIDDSEVKGGFDGSGNSNNTLEITKSKIQNGIKQNTGSLKLFSTDTEFEGGFTGTNSNNVLQIANAKFNKESFTQTGGSLKAELVNIKDVKDFTGVNSINVVQTTRTEFENISQSGGSLDFQTDSKVSGSITGSNNSQNKISLIGADIGGNLTQTTGSMEATLSNGSVQDIQARNARFRLYATNYQANQITLTNAQASGASSDFTLKGAFTQTGGTSNLSFSNSNFQDLTLTNTQSSSLVFTKSTIKDTTATGGNNTINLSDGKMGDFKSIGGSQGIIMTNSKAQSFDAQGGSLTLNASSQSEIKDIKSTAGNLTVSLTSQSKVTQNLSNSDGNTTLSLQDAQIGGNVTQTNELMIFNANQSTIQGSYTQTGGISTTNLTDSKIMNGVSFSNLRAGTLTLNQQSQIKSLKSTNSIFNLNLRNQSFIEQKLEQEGGRIIGNLNHSEIKGGIELQNGTTSLALFQKSKISGGITATNNQTTLLVDDSSIDGDIKIERGFLHLTAQNQSNINSPQLQLNNADLKLTLDTQSKFTGDLTQTNNAQEIIIKQDSIFMGNITNNNTKSQISINHSQLTGNLTQDDGELKLDLSNQGVIGGNVSLKKATTILSGTGMGNKINGNFTQEDGDLKGMMNGLTLQGKYSQNQGTSNVSFMQSSFLQETTIKDANSSLTFNQSNLKDYTTDGGDNTLKLLNTSKMEGNLTLKNNAKTLLEMQTSQIKGNIAGSGQSILTLNLFKSEVTGNLTLDEGGVKGNITQSKIGGKVSLEKTDSKLSLNQSSIGGDFKASGGNVKLDLSNGSILKQNLIIKDQANFHLTGSPANNQIQGNLTTTNSTLTGDISSLTLQGTFTQTQGTTKIIFRDESLLKGAVSITNATSSELEFIHKSGIQNNINITGGNQNKLSLKDQSFIKGNITTTNQSTLNLEASQSLITGDIKAQDATQTHISLDRSTLKGDITQNQGIFKLDAKNQSALTSNLNLTKTQQASITLSQSTLEGKIQAESSDLKIDLKSSSFNNLIKSQEIKINESSLTLQASDQSIFGGNLTQTSTTGNHTSNLKFLQSIFSGTMEFNKIKTTATFTQSKIISDHIKIKDGSFDLTLKDSKEGGMIKLLEGTNTDLKILTKTQSSLKILDASISASTLFLKAEDQSRLIIESLKLDNGTKATYEALTNGNLNVNTFIKDNASTLKVDLHGGILQGIIIQDHINTGELTLREDGGLGGRWGITGDSQIKSLNIQNDAQVFEDGVSIFSSIVNNRLSFVDFTMEFDDQSKSSRMGKEIIAKPAPQPNGVIPPPPAHQTYARVLKAEDLSGNGLFRIYADLGTKMADSIHASKASGTHLIQVYYRAETFRDIGKDRIVVAKVDDPNTTASFKGTQSDIGLTRYDTEIIKENGQNGGFEWILGQATPAGLSYASKIIASILQSQYRLFSLEADSLDRRLGGLENIQRDKGFWVRSFFGQSNKKALSYSINERDNYYSIWSGFDYNNIGLRGHNFLGTFFNYTAMDTQSAAYLGKSSSFAFGFYDVFKAYSGFYFDVLVKYIYSMSAFDITSYALSKNKPQINNHKFLANLEIGHTFYIGEKYKSLYIQPQFQITGGFIQGYSTHFIDVSGEKIDAEIGHNAPAMMRIGAFVGKSFGETIRFNVKGGSSFAYDVNSGGKLNFKDSSNTFSTRQKGDFKMLLSAHADLILGDSFSLYSSFDTSFFGTYSTIFNFNVGLRLTFGRRNNIVADVPMVYNPYTPPPPQTTPDRRNIPIVRNYTTRDIGNNYAGKNRQVSSLIPGNQAFTAPLNLTAQPSPRRGYREGILQTDLKGTQ